MATQTVALNIDALTGQPDYGCFDVLFRKFGKQINWRRLPKPIEYITAAGGSFTDRDNVKWEVTPSGVISYDRLLDKTARDVRMVMFMSSSGEVFYQDEGRTWRRRGHGGKWVEPQKESPLQVPGVEIPGMKPDTQYELCAMVTTSRSMGRPTEPILFTTPASRRRLITTYLEEESLTCPSS